MILSKVKCTQCGGTVRVHGYHTKINRNENLEVTMTVDPCAQCQSDEYRRGHVACQEAVNKFSIASFITCQEAVNKFSIASFINGDTK